MITSVCSTSEYRTIINFDTCSDPKVILINSAPDVVFSLMSQLGILKALQHICILEKVHGHCIKYGISNLLIFCLVGMEVYSRM